jgi:hypothetical protein
MSSFNEIKEEARIFLAELFSYLADVICPHTYVSHGKAYQEIVTFCRNCGELELPQYQNKFTFKEHLLSRLKAELEMPEKVGEGLVKLHTGLSNCKGYKWTEADTIEVATELARLRNISIKRFNKMQDLDSAAKIIEQAFVTVVLPKFATDNYDEVKDALDYINNDFAN